ncbi:unnamed protein product [Oreochromis niloticus]|nr:unnamed protein product [Mustela putorius furo]
MRIPFACLLLVLLFATGRSKLANRQLKWPQKETRYEKFLQQHVDASMTVEKCDEEMKKKWIYNVDNSCKFTNTFILSIKKRVKDICNGRGSPYDTSLTMSKEKFNIVICKLNNRARKRNCQYNGTLHSNVRVVVGCEGRFPVHYEKDIETTESNNATTGKIPMDSTSVPTNIHV